MAVTTAREVGWLSLEEALELLNLGSRNNQPGDGPHALFNTLGRGPTAGLGALIAVAINNLPAAVLLTPEPPHHSRALLLGLNLGPNLALTGSLSALLWIRVARSLDAKPSARTYSAIGFVLVPLSLGAALAALWAASIAA